MAARIDPRVTTTLRWLAANASPRIRGEMATRYGIVTPKAFGIAMAALQGQAKALGTDTSLARQLWETGWYEARTIATMVADPAELSRSQLDAWCRDFDNWAICDTACFKCFDRSPHALSRIDKWAASKDEFVKRAAFALLASVALHRKDLPDAELLSRLPLIDAHAGDGRNFVKKGLSWALRAMGRRAGVKNAALAQATTLAASALPARRWLGKDALRDLKT